MLVDVVVVVVPNDSGVVEGNSNDIDIVVGGANGDSYSTILIWCWKLQLYEDWHRTAVIRSKRVS